MVKTLAKTFLRCTLFFLILSCEKEDDTYTPLAIETTPDTAQLFSNQTIDISIFANDLNVPEKGFLTFSQPSQGNVSRVDNGTTATITDDLLRYTPHVNSSGNYVFTYTICAAPEESCKTETVTVTVSRFSPVNLMLEDFPLPRLSDYAFFQNDLAELQPVSGLIEVEPISQLFTDYAKKKRFIYVPVGEKASYQTDEDALEFPMGSALIKTFYYDNVLPQNDTQLIETRVMVKKANGWDFAEYIWNEDQTDAELEATEDGTFKKVNWLLNGLERFVNYRIPAKTECLICHTNNGETIAIGVSPKSLNKAFSYPSGLKNQLEHLIDLGFLQNNVPITVQTVVDWEDNTLDLARRVRSYLDINCANCHKDGGQGDYRQIRLSYAATADNNGNVGICIDAETTIPGLSAQKLIQPGNPEQSILRYRMNVAQSQFTMPQLGRSLIHEEAINLMDQWIITLEDECN